MELSAEVELVPLPKVRAGGDTTLCLLDWGGSGPTVVLAHGNGFCGALFEPVARALRSHFRVLGFDQRGHGRSAPTDATTLGWSVFRDDLIALLDLLRTRDTQAGPASVIAHSLGGTSALCAAADRPDLFTRLMLLDPVTIAPERRSSPERVESKGRLSAQARKRRSTWPSRDDAHERWRTRGPLSHWDPDVLDLYVTWGLRDASDGGVELACDPAVEASVYEMIDYPDLRDVAARLRTDTLWLYAARGNFDATVVRSIAGSSEAITLEELDAGHLFPMEHPEAIAERALRLLHTPARAAMPPARPAR